MKKLKVLQFICSTGFYGAERWVLALTNNIDGNKVQSELAVTKETAQQDIEILHHFNGKAFTLPMKGRFDVSVISRLTKLISERNINIIHTHGYKSDILGFIAAKKSGIKCVSTLHGFENSMKLKLRIYVSLGCFCLKFFNKVVPLSKELMEEVIRAGVSRSKITYIQNGVDLTEVDEVLNTHRNSHKHNGEKLQIGFIGQMIARKNIADILDIFDKLWQKNSNIRLVLLGDGEKRTELERYATSLSSSVDIEFLGYRNDRLSRLQKFDLFVMTSTYEGIPRCLMEAMAMKIPVAAYDMPGINQLISHEDTGLLAPLGDKDLLAKHWEKLLFDSQYADKIASRGREFVLNNFSAKRMAQEYTDLFFSM